MMISVIGGGTATPEICERAEKVGREIARHGAVLVCGGHGGVMEASCRGARAEGGHTIGILPGLPQNPDAQPNCYVEFPVYTGIGHARNQIVVLSGQAVIAIGGAYGTLAEIAYALIHGVPVIALDTWDFSYEGYEAERIVRVSSAADAVERAIALALPRPPATGTPAQ
jgi:uncharacterized protein (TIGR00725 family)